MEKKKWVKHLPLFIIEILVLIAAIGILFVVLRTTGKNGVKKDVIDTEQIAVNEEVISIIEAIANMGAGMASTGAGYEPSLPEELRK